VAAFRGFKKFKMAAVAMVTKVQKWRPFWFAIVANFENSKSSA
jgi:hypothetical protein